MSWKVWRWWSERWWGWCRPWQGQGLCEIENTSSQGEVVKQLRIHWVSESLHILRRVGMKKQNLSVKWQDQGQKQMTAWGGVEGSSAGQMSFTEAGGFARRNVLEAAVEYKERASSLPTEGQVVQISEVSSTWEIAREAESWGPARFHLEKVTGNKHSRNPWRLKGNFMTTSRRSRGHSGRLILFLFLLVGQGEN